MAFAFSDQVSNRGGITLFIPESGIHSNEGVAIDLSGFAAAGTHYFRFGSQNSVSPRPISYLAHAQIYLNSFIDPGKSITSPLLSKLLSA